MPVQQQHMVMHQVHKQLEMKILENASSSRERSLLNIASNERDMPFTMAMMAGELVCLPLNVRVKMLVNSDNVVRLPLVLWELGSMLLIEFA